MTPEEGIPALWRKIGLDVNAVLEKLMFVWLLSAMVIGHILHNVLSPFQGCIIILFACMTFVTALGTTFAEVGYVIRNPGRVVLAFVLLHVVLPVIAFSIGKATLIHQPGYVTGVVLGSAIPVGVTSVMWTGLAKGDLPLALSIVSLDTLLSPIVLPITVHLIVGTTVHFPFWTMFWGLVWMIVIPTLIGIVINEISRGRVKPAVQPIAGPVSKLALLAVVAINVAVVTPALGHGRDIAVLLITLVVLAGIGYLVGYLAGYFSASTRQRRVAMTYSIGMRNISAGITIATHYFGNDVSIPVVLAMLFQQPLATCVHWLFHRKSQDVRSSEPSNLNS